MYLPCKPEGLHSSPRFQDGRRESACENGLLTSKPRTLHTNTHAHTSYTHNLSHIIKVKNLNIKKKQKEHIDCDEHPAGTNCNYLHLRYESVQLSGFWFIVFLSKHTSDYSLWPSNKPASLLDLNSKSFCLPLIQTHRDNSLTLTVLRLSLGTLQRLSIAIGLD